MTSAADEAGAKAEVWSEEMAAAYDTTSAVMFLPAVLAPAVDFLAALAQKGPALEFAVGTGRVALPLSARGISVQGIELSAPMAAQLRAKPGAEAVAVTIGDMTTTRLAGLFSLVYLVWNGIMNLTSQADQVATFRNAAAHLAPGGCFVLEVMVPQLRQLPAGELGRVFTMDAGHVGIETFDDLVGQISWSHHWIAVEGRLLHHAAPYRYVWPAELDLMAELAGFGLRERYAGWTRAPFTSESIEQVAVYQKLD